MSLTISAAIAAAVDTAATNAATSAYATGLGSGTTLKIYSGAKPATPETAASGTLLATVTTGTWTAASDGSGHLTCSDPASATVAASGTAGWFRLAKSDGTAVIDGTVGTSAADLILDSTALVAGGQVDLGAGTLTVPVSAPVA